MSTRCLANAAIALVTHGPVSRRPSRAITGTMQPSPPRCGYCGGTGRVRVTSDRRYDCAPAAAPERLAMSECSGGDSLRLRDLPASRRDENKLRGEEMEVR